MDGQDGQGQRRPHAVGAQQGLEADPLVAGGEAVEGESVFAHVLVGPEEDVAPQVAEVGHGGGRDAGPVPEAADFDQHLAVGGAVDQPAPQRADHVAASRRALSGAMARWHRARARASAASGGRGRSGSPRRDCTMRCTCSLLAAP